MKELLRKLPPGVKNLARRLVGKSVVSTPLSFLTMSRPDGVAPLRCGLIGLGAMGRTHAELLRQHPFFTLAAISSRQLGKRQEAEAWGARWFDTPQQMIQSGAVDAVVIATPHGQHAEAALAALRAGLHAVCEKPLTLTAAQADEVVRAAKESKGLLTVVFQSRFEPVYQKIKSLLAGGELGPILRCEMVETFWRPEAYYASSPWRATWKGEGGGVLVNQAPHVLDRYLWLCGMPEEVTGFCDTALHQIEVEDAASALLRHAGGRHGHIHVSTNESPAMARTVIVCDRGRIVFDRGVLRVIRLKESLRTHTATATDFFREVAGEECEIPGVGIASPQEVLGRFYTNFALAVAGREPLLVSGEAAAQAVELSNAILLSSASRRALALPLSRPDYDAFLAGKTGSSPT
jgi:predicted dehydrogenase